MNIRNVGAFMKYGDLVSVIIPVFNVRPYLSESIESIISQSYKNLEIIVIDDGSTDGSEIVCDEYSRKDSRIHVIHQENRGLSSSRNVGLDMMSGQVVVFLDSDDAYCPKYIETMLNSMIQNKCDMVICKYLICYTEDRMISDYKAEKHPRYPKGIYNSDDVIRALTKREIDHVVWNKMYSSHLWKEIRFPIGHVFEDLDTTYKIINLCNNILVLDEILYLKRSREGSIIRTYSQRNISDWLLANSHFEEFVRNNTPAIFDERHNLVLGHRRLHKMIDLYVQYIRTNKGKNVTYKKVIRHEIIELEKKIGLGECGMQLHILFYAIRFFPRFFNTIDYIYSPIRYCKRVIHKRMKSDHISNCL